MSAVGFDGKQRTHAVRRACDVVSRALGDATKRPEITSFFDVATNTVSHVIWGPASRRCAVIDAVLNYDAASGHTATEAADKLVALVREQDLQVD